MGGATNSRGGGMLSFSPTKKGVSISMGLWMGGSRNPVSN